MAVSTATITASRLATGTMASTWAIKRSPPAWRNRPRRNNCSASGMSVKGAPFLRAPGLRCTSGM